MIIELQKGGEIVKALERRERILDILCEKRFVTTEYLVNEFKTSRPTIQNDIIELSLSYPVFTKKGTGGGIYIAKGYYRDKRYLTDNQEKALLSAIDKVDKETQVLLESIIKNFSRPKVI